MSEAAAVWDGIRPRSQRAVVARHQAQIVQLPARIRLTVTEGQDSTLPDWLATFPGWRRINGHIVEIDAAPEHKIELLRRVTGAGAPVVDVDVVPPSLDELYAHFLRREEAP